MLWAVLVLALGRGFSSAATAEDPPFVDTKVGSVQLADEASGKAFVLRFGESHPETQFGFAVFSYANASRSETLELVAHPGGMLHEFMEFRLARTGRGNARGTVAAGEASFHSGRGVHLGLSIEELIRLLGKPHDEVPDGGDRTLVYRCTSPTTCPVLSRVNMPAYEGRYSFQDGALVAFRWGYPYP